MKLFALELTNRTEQQALTTQVSAATEGTEAVEPEKKTPEVGKLVRDKTPEFIRAKGGDPIIMIANKDECGSRLRMKLLEEAGEFLTADGDKALDELADVLEVIYSLTLHMGASLYELENRRLDKRADRGGFDKGFIWYGNKS